MLIPHFSGKVKASQRRHNRYRSKKKAQKYRYIQLNLPNLQVDQILWRWQKVGQHLPKGQLKHKNNAIHPPFRITWRIEFCNCVYRHIRYRKRNNDHHIRQKYQQTANWWLNLAFPISSTARYCLVPGSFGPFRLNRSWKIRCEDIISSFLLLEGAPLIKSRSLLLPSHRRSA
jgi:hypothetical protein